MAAVIFDMHITAALKQLETGHYVLKLFRFAASTSCKFEMSGSSFEMTVLSDMPRICLSLQGIELALRSTPAVSSSDSHDPAGGLPVTVASRCSAVAIVSGSLLGIFGHQVRTPSVLLCGGVCPPETGCSV